MNLLKLKWLIVIEIWITFTWDAVPGAKNYRIEISNTYGRTWSNVSYGATTETRIPIPDNMGLILLRLTVIYEDEGSIKKDERKSSIGWWFDPSLGSPYMVNLGVQ